MNWEEYYYIGNTNIIDAAVLWRQNSYIPNTFMCLSFQFKKHLNLGRGGMILLDNLQDYKDLKAMVYDGRERNIPWAEQNISKIGYHYYMTPEVAEEGIKKFNIVKDATSKNWSYLDYPDLQNMKVFKDV
jgi:dTDP-4-amino-4,6-dideoxygalactose transaminase